MSSDKDNLEVILEDMNGKFDCLIEVTAHIQDELKTKASQESVDEINAKLQMNSDVVTEHSGQLNDHEARITHLEAA